MRHQTFKLAISFVVIVVSTPVLFAQKANFLQVIENKINYIPDSLGNQVLDFSYCGYQNSNIAIPTLQNQLFVPFQESDCSEQLQQAINWVSSLKPDKNGFRGAVLLDKGVFKLSKPLFIQASGVVIRGVSKTETILEKNGYDKGALIYIEGKNNQQRGGLITMESDYIPVNQRSVRLLDSPNLRVGDRVFINRDASKNWIEQLKCDHFGGGITSLGWKEGDQNLTWDRTIVRINGNEIEFDAPLTMALDPQQGTVTVQSYQWGGRLEHCGVENITLISDWNRNNPKDEDHCWNGVSISNAENCWVRHLNFRHFAGSAVILQSTASRITVEDCVSEDPISEIGGMRRMSFHTLGQLNLFQRCVSMSGVNDFSAGSYAAGPNAFVQCESHESFGPSGAVGSWAPGLLFDVVDIDGSTLSFKNWMQEYNGVGWGTGNSMFWQCTASEIDCFSPSDDAKNRAYACWSSFSGDGEWMASNNHATPRSLFYAQLTTRLDRNIDEQAKLLPINTNASSSPTIEAARQMSLESMKPKITLIEWINRNPLSLPTSTDKLRSSAKLNFIAKIEEASKANILLVNGKLLCDDKVMFGTKHEVSWWNGSLRERGIKNAKPHLTRFVPGREGMGLTDRIDSVVTDMKRSNTLILDHNYGLWYDRRRDDHQRIRRKDATAWAPFYEQPFARSGVGTAWDGLSKYDLNKPNLWYWQRLKDFAVLAEKEGLLLYHQNYFQHNILEAGAHWVDSPWRSANNINESGFIEPVPFAGDKRIFTADLFYDIEHPIRRELHRNYIRQCLDNFAENRNVIQLISAEYTGPLHFVQFWLDVIAEWENETGKDVLVALSTTKDVQDAILQDQVRSKIIDIIDIRYWHYRNDGTLYAPEGGLNLAPRQHARLEKIGKSGFHEVYRAVSEYRESYPDKAVTYFGNSYPDHAWATFMAGGSCIATKPVENKRFLVRSAQMKVDKFTPQGVYSLVKSDIGCVIYSQLQGVVSITLDPGVYTLMYLKTGSCDFEVLDRKLVVSGDYQLNIAQDAGGIYWLDRN